MTHAKACNAQPPCRTQEEMTKKHGTPRQFREACIRAIGDISPSEALIGANAYEREWCSAPSTSNAEPK